MLSGAVLVVLLYCPGLVFASRTFDLEASVSITSSTRSTWGATTYSRELEEVAVSVSEGMKGFRD